MQTVPSPDSGRHLPSGTRLGRWTLDWPLGEGAAGVVYRCHADDGPPRALKLLTIAGDATSRARFAREITILRALDHPAIVPLVDAGESEGTPWLVMALAAGRPLAALAGGGPAPDPFIVGIAAQLADALAYAHAHGVAHRDVKPSNVLVDGDGNAVLVDLGIAAAADVSRLTRTGERSPTTPRYAPPEWWLGRGGEPSQADVYALGVVIHELLTGAAAWGDVPPAELLDEKLARPLDPGPGGLRALVRAMTDPDPTRRPSAAEVAARLPPPPQRRPTVRSDPTLDVPAPLADGTIGPYRLLGELGRGGMGVVYRAEPVGGGPVVALKIMLRAAPEHTRRFRQEIAALARLDHPTLLPVRDVGEHDGRMYYTMEWVDGPDLATVLRERGVVAPEVAVGWGIELARALAYAHRQGILHRDVKPGNVLLEGGRRVRLADFGLARELYEGTALTQAGEVLGTPRYMAPEQARGQRVGPAADIYALGGLIQELVAGRSEVVPGVPAELARIVEKARSPDPDDRYPDMDQLADDLARVQAGRLAVGARPTVGGLARRLLRRHRDALGVAAGLLALGIAGLTVREGLRAREAAAREADAAVRLATVESTVHDAIAAGDNDTADRAFRSFVELPENQGTRAVARAWLAQADRLAGLDEGDAQRDALAHAWATARHPEEAERALVGLARSLDRRLDGAGLAAAVATLRSHGVSGGDASALEAASAASRRDFATATHLDRREGAGPLLAALGRAARTAPNTAVVGDLAIGGARSILVWEDGRRLALAPAGDLALARRAPLPLPGGRLAGIPRLLQPPGGEPLVLVWDTREAALCALRPDGAHELVHWPESQYKPAIVADLDGDGRWGALLGTRAPGRRLVALDPDATGAWRVSTPHPPSNEQNSAFVGLGWADFNGDGAAELWQARGAFGAYDVRMLHPAGDSLALVGRRKLGDVQDGAALRGPEGRARMLVVRADMWPSRLGLPPDAPFGEPRGIYVLDWDGARFTTAWYRPTEAECIDSQVADLDGDGLDDVAVNCGQTMVVARQLPDGGFIDVTVGNATLLGAADVDGDGDRELQLAEPDGATWFVGAGDDHLPVLPEPAEPAPAGGLPAVERAEELVRMGLVAEGIQALDAQIAQSPAGAGRERLRVRMAELQERIGRTDRAAESYLAAADEPALRVAALQGAARCFEAEMRDDRALAALDSLLGDGGLDDPTRASLTHRRARLAARAAAPSVTLDFRRGLPDAVDVLDPLQAWYDPAAGALRVRQAADGAVARVPLTWDGQLLQLDLDLDLTRFEWAARLYVQVEPAAGGRDAWGAQVRSVGGAGNLITAPGCSLATDTPPALGWEPRSGPEWGDHVNVRITVDPATGEGACVWDGLPTRFQARQPLKALPPPGDYVLVVRGQLREGVSLADAAIRRISLRGASLRDAPPEPWAAARRALATQAPGPALAALTGATGPEAALLRTFALDELGRWEEADRSFATLARGDGATLLRSRAPVLLQARGERFVGRMRTAAGTSWPALLWQAWGPSIRHQPDDARWQAALASDLGPVDPFPGSPELVSLLVARGKVWRVAGRLPLAEQDLTRALALADTLPDASDVRATRAAALLELAALRVAQGRADEATALTLRSIASAPAPETWADVALHLPELAPLHDAPGWGEVRAATRIP